MATPPLLPFQKAYLDLSANIAALPVGISRETPTAFLELFHEAAWLEATCDRWERQAEDLTRENRALKGRLEAVLGRARQGAAAAAAGAGEAAKALPSALGRGEREEESDGEEDQRIALKAELAAEKADCEALLEMLRTSHARMDQWAGIKESIDLLDRKCRGALRAKTALKQESDLLQQNYDALSASFSELKKEKGSAESAVRRLKVQLEKKEEKNKELSAIAATVSEELAEQVKELEELRKKQRNHDSSFKELQQKHADRIAELEEDCRAYHERYEADQQRLDALQETLSAERAKNEALQKKLDELSASLAEERARVEEAQEAALARPVQFNTADLERLLFGTPHNGTAHQQTPLDHLRVKLQIPRSDNHPVADAQDIAEHILKVWALQEKLSGKPFSLPKHSGEGADSAAGQRFA